MSLTVAAYRALGGIEPLAALEDEALERALRAAGMRIDRLTSVRVRTSARLVGRASAGLAHDLAAATDIRRPGPPDNSRDGCMVVRRRGEGFRRRGRVMASRVARASSIASMLTEQWGVRERDQELAGAGAVQSPNGVVRRSRGDQVIDWHFSRTGPALTHAPEPCSLHHLDAVMV